MDGMLDLRKLCVCAACKMMLLKGTGHMGMKQA